ncbi:MAG: tail fiber domain-containing protein [Bacteroidales bacterium]
MLDVRSATRGFLFPRMNMGSIVGISNPATGLMVYNSDDNNFFVNRGAPLAPDWTIVNSKWRVNGPDIFFTGNNVGIGWHLPIAKLDIRGNNPDDGATFQLSNSDLSHRLLIFGGRENDHDPFINWKQGDALRFMTDESGGSEKMRITSDGMVGIGTDSCTALLHVNGTRMMWYPDQAVFRAGAVSDDRWDSLYLGSFSTAIGYNCVASGDVSFSLGSYTWATNTCSAAIGHGAQSTAYAATALGYNTLASGYATTAMGDNTVAQAYVSTAIGQYNVGSGTENSWVETDPIFEIGIGPGWTNRKNAMTVLKNGHGGLMIQNNATTPVIYCNQSNGYVGIGSSSPTQALHVVGDAYKTLGGNTWAASSDILLKVLLGNYTKGLDEITALQPVRFIYKENNPRQLPVHVEQLGFVAQDVQKVFPEAVSEAEDGYLDFNIHAINVAMVNAVKELNQKVALQQKEIDDLKALVSSLLADQ